MHSVLPISSVQFPVHTTTAAAAAAAAPTHCILSLALTRSACLYVQLPTVRYLMSGVWIPVHSSQFTTTNNDDNNDDDDDVNNNNNDDDNNNSPTNHRLSVSQSVSQSVPGPSQLTHSLTTHSPRRQRSSTSYNNTWIHTPAACIVKKENGDCDSVPLSSLFVVRCGVVPSFVRSFVRSLRSLTFFLDCL